MKVLVVGSGGREHALVWKIKQSPRVKAIFCAPGNGGIHQIATCVNIKADDVKGLLDFAKKENIDLTVVGPEAPLVLGIVDEFQKNNLKVFGPPLKAAQLEGSKVFAKEFMKRCNIPTASFESFSDLKKAQDYVRQQKFPLVVKADGLAAGKGVAVCFKLQEALDFLDEVMAKKVFKEAGNKVIVEECLQGEEASILAVCDGEHYILLDSSQDHKRIFDGDQGPNTGGMGAYSPAPVVTKDLWKIIGKEIIEPVVVGMKKEGSPYKGILYAGLMITQDGANVLEFNVRFGDPETQAVLPRLKTDLVDIMEATCDGCLDKIKLTWDRKACVSVVVSSKGYPGDYEKGKPISGLEKATLDSHTVVFHAGTQLRDNQIVTSGGRVLAVTSLGDDVAKAIKNAYNTLEKIHFEGCFYRKDIGAKALKR